MLQLHLTGGAVHLNLSYDYQQCVENSEKVSWTIDSIFPKDTRLDFSRRFLPEALAPTAALASFLDEAERRALNQIAGNAYLNLFAFVEEYILATVVKHSQAEMFGDLVAMRALCRFADEEAKHQQLFGRYLEAFNRDFGVKCGVLGSAVEVAGVVMSKTPIAVLLLTLHIEHMTQQHFTECVRDDATIDPLFAKLLKHHWLEEAQHAKIDALELKKLAADASPEQILQGFKDYGDLGAAVAGLLDEQAKMDVVSLQAKTGRTFTLEQSARIHAQQLAGYKKTFLWYGMTNPNVVDIFRQLDPQMAAAVEKSAAAL